MKRVKYAFLTLLACTVCAAGFTACTAEEPALLATPTNLAVSDEGILTWDKVEGATAYGVDIDDKYYETDTNSLDIFDLTAEYKTFEISVTAYGDVKSTLDSEPSETLEYVVEDCGTGELLTNGVGLKSTGDKAAYNVEGYNSKAKGKIIIPAEYNGKPVVAVSYKAFYECEAITSIILPDSIDTIAEKAFYGCVNLKRIKLSCNIGTIEGYAFSGCKNLSMFSSLSNSPKSKSAGLSRTRSSSIGYLPDSLNELGPFAFVGCSSLTEIRLPDTLKALDGGCEFWGCSSLTEIELPQSLTEIKVNPFVGCDGLKSITMPMENDYVKTEGNCIIRKKDNALIAGCKTSVIPDYVKTIEAGAFRRLSSLTKIDIPEGVETIKSVAFEGSGLTELNLSTNVELIPETAFSGCKNLGIITVAEGNAVYRSEGNCLIRKADNALVLGSNQSVIPDGVEKIAKNAFDGSGITKIKLPKSVKTIEYRAFAECSELTEVILSDGLIKIGQNAFDKCSGLTNIAIPASVEEIQREAFKGSKALSVVLPHTVQKIGQDAMKDCTVYTSAENRLEGWNGGVLRTYEDGTTNLYLGCTFGYEDGVPYILEIGTQWQLGINS